jgi:competence protein ComEA
VPSLGVSGGYGACRRAGLAGKAQQSVTAWRERYRTPLLIALSAIAVLGLIFFVLRQRESPPALELRVSDTASSDSEIMVHVAGAVAAPGVYALHEGDRVVDAVEAAGGPSSDADLVTLNLARRIHDEDQVVVPRIGEPPTVSQVASAQTSPDGLPAGGALIDINTASAAVLDSLPGIGEVYSKRIVDSRVADGPFQSTEDLVARQLIPRATYEKIKNLITASP